MTETTTVRLKTPAIIADETRPAGWEGDVDTVLATRMRDDGVAEPEAGKSSEPAHDDA